MIPTASSNYEMMGIMHSEEKFAEVTRKSKAKRAEMKANSDVQKAAALQRKSDEEAARNARETADATSRVFAAFDETPPEHD
jgi:hypothetical protein